MLHSTQVAVSVPSLYSFLQDIRQPSYIPDGLFIMVSWILILSAASILAGVLLIGRVSASTLTYKSSLKLVNNISSLRGQRY